MADELLRVEGASKSFGGLQALANVDLSIARGAIYGLIGPNGAGKTTFVNMLTGALPASSGRIFMDGEEITNAPQSARTKRGLGRTFQITSLFRSLSVLDNVALGIAEREGVSLSMWKPASSFHVIRDEAMAHLEKMGLQNEASSIVRDLPYGKQRLIEIAIALGLKPKVLLLDEPAAGVPSIESGRILDVLAELPEEIAILIIEHDMDLVFRFASKITVLVQGAVLTEGTPDEIANDQRVRDVYLGEGGHD